MPNDETGGAPEKPIPGGRAEYDATEGMNWSLLKEMDKSPLHHKYRRDNPRSDTDAFRLGRVLHLAVLEPGRVADELVVWDGGVRRGKKWDAFRGDHEGKEILTVAENERVVGMATALYGNEAAAYYLQHDGPAEHNISWRDPKTQQKCKARLDKVADCVVEVKSARNVSPYTFAAAAFRMHYHGQLAYYHDGLKVAEPDRELTGAPVILAVESLPPHDVAVYTCSEVIALGRELYERLLGRLSECRLVNEWPGCCPGAMPMEPPRWADPEDDDADWSGVEKRPSAAGSAT